MSNQSSKTPRAFVISKRPCTVSTTMSSMVSSNVDEDSTSRRLNFHQCEDYTVSSLGTADDSYFSGSREEPSAREFNAKVYMNDPRGTQVHESSSGPKVHVASNFHVKRSPSPANGQLLPVAVATPVTPCTPDQYCPSCKRKNGKLKKQAEEIEQLKSLVNHLVGLLGSSLSENTGGSVDAATQEDPRENHPELGSLVRTPSRSSSTTTTPLERKGTVPAESSDETESPGQQNLGDVVPSTPPSKDAKTTPPSNLIGQELSPARSLDEERPVMVVPLSPTGTMLRLCQLKNLKDESGTPSPKTSSGTTRHIHVCVRGDWGYYSGPTLEQNKKLHGCVVRFDNGDLYLGEMLLYVPKTTTFTDEHGLQFHGRGTLYRKGGPTIRGLFHKHEIKE